ncbi:MAG: peptidoglycan-binding protein [Rhizobiales bacterium]|nr:peptidoglycan-binding protein [Hyphomicrobiales bacterium]
MTQATAWVFYVDQRLVSKSSQVGRITFVLPEGTSTGTAFLVDECEVLSNFHVVFGPWYVSALRPPSPANQGIFELAEVTLADGSHPQAQAVPVAWGDYTGPDRQLRRPGEDWVLLTLDKCLGQQYGYYTLVDPAYDDDAAESGSLAAIGYSSGRQMVDSRCSIHWDGRKLADGALFHDCATLQGDSGGPIVKRGTNRVVAIASGYRSGKGLCAVGTGYLRWRWSGDCTNTAVPMSLAVTGRIDTAMAAARAQRELLRLGYDAGRPGDIADPKLAAAIRAFQRQARLLPTGEASWSLVALLCLRRLNI